MSSSTGVKKKGVENLTRKVILKDTLTSAANTVMRKVQNTMESVMAGPTETQPKAYKVIHRGGAMVRADVSLESAPVQELRKNDVVTVAQIVGRRARIVTPSEGWVSLETKSGEVIFKQCNFHRKDAQREAFEKTFQKRWNKVHEELENDRPSLEDMERWRPSTAPNSSSGPPKLSVRATPVVSKTSVPSLAPPGRLAPPRSAAASSVKPPSVAAVSGDDLLSFDEPQQNVRFQGVPSKDSGDLLDFDFSEPAPTQPSGLSSKVEAQLSGDFFSASPLLGFQPGDGAGLSTPGNLTISPDIFSSMSTTPAADLSKTTDPFAALSSPFGAADPFASASATADPFAGSSLGSSPNANPSLSADPFASMGSSDPFATSTPMTGSSNVDPFASSAPCAAPMGSSTAQDPLGDFFGSASTQEPPAKNSGSAAPASDPFAEFDFDWGAPPSAKPSSQLTDLDHLADLKF